MLTEQEQQYFDDIVTNIKLKFNIIIPILAYDHEKVEGHENALGIAYADENKKVYQITVDEFFIHECYCDHRWSQGIRGANSWPKLEPESLEGLICHEIAHMKYLRHGRWHKRETERLLKVISNEHSQSA